MSTIKNNIEEAIIDPCGACTARYGAGNFSEINSCCFNTCASFVSGGPDAVLQSDCAAKCNACMAGTWACNGGAECKIPAQPVIHLNPQNFKTCYAETDDMSSALSCCMSKCKDHASEQQCIDDYNSVVFVEEGFRLPGGTKVSRNLAFYLGVCALTALWVLGYLRLPARQPKHVLALLLALYSVLYLVLLKMYR